MQTTPEQADPQHGLNEGDGNASASVSAGSQAVIGTTGSSTAKARFDKLRKSIYARDATGIIKVSALTSDSEDDSEEIDEHRQLEAGPGPLYQPSGPLTSASVSTAIKSTSTGSDGTAELNKPLKPVRSSKTAGFSTSKRLPSRRLDGSFGTAANRRTSTKAAEAATSWPLLTRILMTSGKMVGMVRVARNSLVGEEDEIPSPTELEPRKPSWVSAHDTATPMKSCMCEEKLDALMQLTLELSRRGTAAPAALTTTRRASEAGAAATSTLRTSLPQLISPSADAVELPGAVAPGNIDRVAMLQCQLESMAEQMSRVMSDMSSIRQAVAELSKQ